VINLYKRCGVALGCALLVFLHFYKLGTIPGLHYDEAWAMNYAWRIAHEPGFWPLTAMSPYTAPWAHYWAALCMKVIGPSVLVFRGSQVVLALAGICCLAAALPKHIRAAFPWAIILLPGLLLNERFAIELTGFHVLCFGALVLSMRREKFGLACVAALFGTTAHILFYAVALSGIALVFLQGWLLSFKQRAWVMLYFMVTAVFLARVLGSIPEKGKGAALVFSAALVITGVALEWNRWPLWRKPAWSYLLGLAGLIYGFNCAFFAQGFWAAAVAKGIPFYNVDFQTLAFWIGFLGLLYVCARGWAASPSWIPRAFLLLTVACGVLMLKPAPRYFELPMLVLACLLTYDLASWIYLVEWPVSRRLHLLTALSGVLALNTGITLANTALLPSVNAPIHFLFFKDSSRDFTDKHVLVEFLGGSGCARSDIHTGDPRLKEELDALALGDWPVNHSGPCRWNFVSLQSEAGSVGEPWYEFKIRRKN
jgi:hypothetical protein